MRARIPLFLLIFLTSKLPGAAQSGLLVHTSIERIESYCFGCPGGGEVGVKPHATAELTKLAKANDPALQKAIEETYPAKALELGRVWNSHEHDFFFALRAPSQPQLLIDGQPGPLMESIPGTDLWYSSTRIDRVAAIHGFRYKLNGKEFGGNPSNMPVYSQLSYPSPNVEQGALSEKMTLNSKIFDGLKTDYWIYLPSSFDPKIPATVMIFLDGSLTLSRDHGSKTLDVIDNLVALKRVPPLICVFVDPGTFDDSKNPTVATIQDFASRTQRTMPDATRSFLYDTVSDRYPRFLSEELLPTIATRFKIRNDAYSHAVLGFSSGGIAAFNAAWQLPHSFSRVICGIGSFTSIQWKTFQNSTDGGQDFPDKVLQEQRRNIRVWLQEGSEDNESPKYGSWPLNNIRLANALKLAGYDFHFVFDGGAHGPESIEAQLPDVLTWLWRDYDPARTEQTFEMEPAERSRPLFRVAIVNRDAR